jgi:molecular chaperone DnaK
VPGPSPLPREKRKYVSLRLRFKHPNLSSFIDAFAANLGKGGMFVASKDPLPAGTHLHFEFFLAENTPVFTGTGVVRWTRQVGDLKGLPGMGVQFEALPEASPELVGQMMKRRVAGDKTMAAATGPVVPPKAPIRRNTVEGWKPLEAATHLPTSGTIVGIDLGTSNTCAATMSNGRPVVLRTRDGYPTIPSGWRSTHWANFWWGGWPRSKGCSTRLRRSTATRAPLCRR